MARRRVSRKCYGAVCTTLARRGDARRNVSQIAGNFRGKLRIPWLRVATSRCNERMQTRRILRHGPALSQRFSSSLFSLVIHSTLPLENPLLKTKSNFEFSSQILLFSKSNSLRNKFFSHETERELVQITFVRFQPTYEERKKGSKGRAK